MQRRSGLSNSTLLAGYMELTRHQEITNNVSCIFIASGCQKYSRNCSPSFRSYNRNIRNNTGNLISRMDGARNPAEADSPAWRHRQQCFVKDQDGKTAFEKEVEILWRAFAALSRS